MILLILDNPKQIGGVLGQKFSLGAHLLYGTLGVILTLPLGCADQAAKSHHTHPHMVGSAPLTSIIVCDGDADVAVGGGSERESANESFLEAGIAREDYPLLSPAWLDRIRAASENPFDISPSRILTEMPTYSAGHSNGEYFKQLLASPFAFDFAKFAIAWQAESAVDLVRAVEKPFLSEDGDSCAAYDGAMIRQLHSSPSKHKLWAYSFFNKKFGTALWRMSLSKGNECPSSLALAQELNITLRETQWPFTRCH